MNHTAFEGGIAHALGKKMSNLYNTHRNDKEYSKFFTFLRTYTPVRFWSCTEIQRKTIANLYLQNILHYGVFQCLSTKHVEKAQAIMPTSIALRAGLNS